MRFLFLVIASLVCGLFAIGTLAADQVSAPLGQFQIVASGPSTNGLFYDSGTTSGGNPAILFRNRDYFSSSGADNIQFSVQAPDGTHTIVSTASGETVKQLTGSGTFSLPASDYTVSFRDAIGVEQKQLSVTEIPPSDPRYMPNTGNGLGGGTSLGDFGGTGGGTGGNSGGGGGSNTGNGSGGGGGKKLVPCTSASECTLDKIKQVAINIFNLLMGIGSVAAVGAIVWAGFNYITSRGDAKKMAEAKQGIVNAVVGLVLLLMSVVLVNFFLKAIGAKNADVQKIQGTGFDGFTK